jgi:transposase-like protein
VASSSHTKQYGIGRRVLLRCCPVISAANGRGKSVDVGPKVKHRCSAYANRRIERDHRGVKQRYYPMLGFGEFRSAQRFCRAFEEVRQYFRPRRKQNEAISLSTARQQFLFRALELESMFLEA